MLFCSRYTVIKKSEPPESADGAPRSSDPSDPNNAFDPSEAGAA